MIADRYYYSKLTDKQKQLYKLCYKGFLDMDTQIVTKPIMNPEKILNPVLEAIIADNPHIFYVDGSNISYQYSVKELVIIPTYMYSKKEVGVYNQKISIEATRIVNGITKTYGSDQVQIVTALYRYFCRKYCYDQAALTTKNQRHICEAHSILGAFIAGTAVCEGFAKAFKFLLNSMDMKCIIVQGEADFPGDSAHAWNMVKINNKSYHVDSTWGLCISDENNVRYDYLYLSDKDISQDHRNFFGYPKCDNDDLEYYKMNGMEIDNSIHLKNYIKKAINKRDNSVEFKVVKGTGKCGFLGNEDVATITTDACSKAAMEAGVALQYKIQYVENKMTCKVEFTY